LVSPSRNPGHKTFRMAVFPICELFSNCFPHYRNRFPHWYAVMWIVPIQGLSCYTISIQGSVGSRLIPSACRFRDGRGISAKSTASGNRSARIPALPFSTLLAHPRHINKVWHAQSPSTDNLTPRDLGWLVENSRRVHTPLSEVKDPIVFFIKKLRSSVFG